MPVDLEALSELVELVLAEEGYPADTEGSLLLVADSEMASYNERFMNRPGPTDVLSFPVERLIPGVVPEVKRQGPPVVLGDVILAPSYIEDQARKLGEDLEDEVALMAVHGILHLLGYDHEKDEDAELMERRETKLLAKVGRKRR